MEKFVQKRQLKDMIAELRNNILNLQHEISTLQRNNSNLRSQMVELANFHSQQIKEMKENVSRIIDFKVGELEKKIQFYEDNFIMYPKQEMIKMPFLQYMCDYYISKRINPNYQNFCSLIYFLHQRSYNVIRKFLPVLPGSFIRSETHIMRNTLKANLLDINQIPSILYDLYQNSEGMHVTIAGDAASIKPVSEKGDSAVYTFMIVPIKKMYKNHPLHMMITQNGSSSPEVVSRFFHICDIVEKCNFSIDFVATDGDASFDFMHLDFFSQNKSNYSK